MINISKMYCQYYWSIQYLRAPSDNNKAKGTSMQALGFRLTYVVDYAV